MIICGWYTPNYAPYAERLKETIPKGLRFDFTAMLSSTLNWATLTRLKARMALRFRETYSNETLMLIDVDAEIIGNADDIVNICASGADVSVRVSSRPDKGSLYWPNSALLVLQPTKYCNEMLHHWAYLCESVTDKFTDDEHCLARAMAETPGLIVRALPVEARPLDSDGLVESPIIRFRSASTELGLRK